MHANRYLCMETSMTISGAGMKAFISKHALLMFVINVGLFVNYVIFITLVLYS